MDKAALYFAYSTDINARTCSDGARRTGSTTPLRARWQTPASPITEIIFNYRERENRGRVSNIRRRFGQAMPGVLFEVKPDGWKAIEAKKLVPRCYGPSRRSSSPKTAGSREAVAYRVFADRIAGTFYPPRLDYAAVLREGLLSHGLRRPDAHGRRRGQGGSLDIDHIFVYGTLMKGFARHHLLEAWAHPMTRQEARAPGILFDSRKGHPCLVPAKKEGASVKGELYRLQGQPPGLRDARHRRGLPGLRGPPLRVPAGHCPRGDGRRAEHAGLGLFLQPANGEARCHRVRGLEEQAFPGVKRFQETERAGPITGSRPFLFIAVREKTKIPEKTDRPDGTMNPLGANPQTAIRLLKGCYVSWNRYQRNTAPQKMTRAKMG